MKFFVALLLISTTLSSHENQFFLKYDHKLMKQYENQKAKPVSEWGNGYGFRNFKFVDECGNLDPVCGVNNITYKNKCECVVQIKHVGNCNSYINRSSYWNYPEDWMLQTSQFGRGGYYVGAESHPFYY